HTYETEYAVTFAIMLISSLLTGTLANKLKDNAIQSSREAFRAKVLFDTNQLLRKANTDAEIINITGTQLMKLLNRSVVIFVGKSGALSKCAFFSAIPSVPGDDVFGDNEISAAECAVRERQRTGATTGINGDAKYLYMPILTNDRVYGAAGILIGPSALDSFENSLLLSILGECALSIDSNRNAKEKEEVALLAKNEQLRANLLRTISHDLRTPLTSIYGNAGNLLSNWEKLDREERTQIFTDIQDDSSWLMSLVENLLSVSRIEEGKLNLNTEVQLMDEVIEEAMRHLDRKASEHNTRVEYGDELLLARMDAKLIVQVIINLVGNAVKYTRAGSNITVFSGKKGKFVEVRVSDDGDGIPDAVKPRVFDMFYTGDNVIADSRRSLGLGLALCRSIVNAHGGELVLSDNEPSGCVFSFTIPSGEVNINE
ncbi:MAG: histidine kinase, partial [Clostridia bacterium]|nr:histidine kinase [Clostridia bacterium]